ncbi:alanine racemase [Ancylomarina sp.]|uniref:alanine racemase n=1 Tax=Ancylomarina sp. TaxID=1970196 RepID=UPI003567A744
MASTSQIVIKSEALEQNVKFVKSLLDKSTTISAVIKGNAYGHGTEIVVPALEQLGINHFSVYSSAEAKVAFEVKSPKSVIMIMGFIYKEDYQWVIENDIEFFVSCPEAFKLVLETVKRIQKKAIIHIDLETGMNRTGLEIKQLRRIIPMIKANEESLIIRGICSHFAGAESIANQIRIKKQFSVFKKRVKLLNDNDIYSEVKHIASSAATINYPETRLDLVRVGIILYGYWPTTETFIHYIHRRKDKTDPLKRALRWCTEVALVKTVTEGEFIGYGMSFQAQRTIKIMIIPVGYSTGYSRSLSNNGHVIVNGFIAPIVGTVNMNMIICDITNLPKIKVGDPVILIGKQDVNEISFTSFAEMNNSLNYEILARLPESISRELV